MNNSQRFSRSDFEPASLMDILRWRALHQPNKRVFTFLTDGETQAANITYDELDCQARAIGALLQTFVTQGECAVLLYPPGLDFITGLLGCLYAGVIAVPAYPPNSINMDRTLTRLQAVLKDVQAAVVLTTSPILNLAHFLFDKAPDLGALQWMATDSVAGGLEYGWCEPKVRPDTQALLNFASVTSSKTQGVMVSHSNLLHNSWLISQGFGLTSDDVGMTWLPPYDLIGLMNGILQPLSRGATSVLMSPKDFMQKPLRWLQAISRYKATVSGGPNFAYDLCVRNITPEQRDTIDLSSWVIAFTGGTPIRSETMDRFAAYFAPCGFRKEAFYPCYGLPDRSLIASGGEKYTPGNHWTIHTVPGEQNRVVVTGQGKENEHPLASYAKNLMK